MSMPGQSAASGCAESYEVNGGGPQLGDLLSMGLTLAACVVAGFGLGWLVDRFVGSFPGFALAGLALGIVAASFYFYKTFKRFS